MPTVRRRVTRAGGPAFDDVLMSFLQGEKPPERLTEAQAQAVCDFILLAAPEGHAVVNGRVVALPEGASTDNPHWRAWLKVAT